MTKGRISVHELMKIGREQEGKSENTAATDSYKQVLKKDALNAGAYHRLMVLYRKQKDYKKELAVIQKAIQMYEKDIKQDQQAWRKKNQQSADLSQDLAKALGLVNEDGLPVYEEPHISTWRKRLETVQKKLEASSLKRKK
jgi:tetratricopeptide (TPR) repeat protein